MSGLFIPNIFVGLYVLSFFVRANHVYTETVKSIIGDNICIECDVVSTSLHRSGKMSFNVRYTLNCFQSLENLRTIQKVPIHCVSLGRSATSYVNAHSHAKVPGGLQLPYDSEHSIESTEQTFLNSDP